MQLMSMHYTISKGGELIIGFNLIVFTGYTESKAIMTLRGRIMAFSNFLRLALYYCSKVIFANLSSIIIELGKGTYDEAAPTAFIEVSNFFELDVAVSKILFGVSSGVTLAVVVGVLVEVPVMLSLVEIMKRNRSKFNYAGVK